MTYLKFNQATETKSKITSRLIQLGLECDERMMQTLEENPQHINRLTSLFSILKKYDIKLDSILHDTIASNVSHASAVANLLEFMHSEGIDAELVPLERLFACAKSETILKSGMRKLKTCDALDSVTLKLIFAYPEQSSLIADLIINFQEHTYPTDKIVEKLHKFSEKNMSTVIELLTMLLNKSLYYFDCFDILLRQQEYIDKIYEGTKKLAAENKLAPTYFEVIENNPKNANILANAILLLHHASLLDYRKTEDVLIASQLGIGEFHFLMHLQQAGMLNAENYQKVCHHNLILTQHKVIELFSSLPLFEEFEKEELEQMLLLITKESSLDAYLNEFVEIIQKHQFSSKPHL